MINIDSLKLLLEKYEQTSLEGDPLVSAGC